MTDYLVKTYGGVALTGTIAAATIEESLAVRQLTAVPVGRGGRYDAGSLHDGLNLTFTGTVKPNSYTDPAAAQAAWDSLKSLFAPGPPKKLYINSDRYCNASVSSELRAEAWKGLPTRKYSITLSAYDDPPWFADTPTTQALSVGATTFTTAGTGKADPIITAVVSAAPSGALVSITDAAGNVCTLAPDATGTFVIDSLAEQITKGGVDKTALLGTSQFLRLLPGSNTLTVAVSGGATLSSVSVVWADRWY